ncbi:hypothetical protein [Dickeya zeae]|uniref:hypothetical protein n=1 Tax=Dickeya zeae TaxID=204042 RepID=UPI002046C382|nr:hypothetical protein [Dickeya zeae]UPT57210.1 hypothetical protein FGI00_17405 [Dickeya zeae]
MFDFSFEKKEILIYVLYFLLFFFVINRTYGISNLLRFVFRYFKIDYSDRKMKTLDESWFNIQLFKIINGINISNIEDARIIQKGLNEGILKPSIFFLTSSWGDIAQEKTIMRISLEYFVGFLFLTLGSFSWYLQNPINYGYAKIDYKEFSYHISKDRMVITNQNAKISHENVYSKQDCRNGLSVVPETSVYAIACKKLLNENDSFQWWLTEKIESTNKEKRNLQVLSYSYCAIGFILLYSLTQFIYASRKVRAYKNQSK